MAQLKYVDWDGLVYYDGKVKAYIDDKMTSCLKMGGHIEFQQLPPPSYNNLNYIYKITDEFTSNEHFVSPGYQFNENTWIQVVDIEGLYKYNIFDEADQTTSEILSQLDALNVRTTSVENNIETLESGINEAHTLIAEVSGNLDQLSENVEKDRAEVAKLDDKIDELQQTVLAVFNDNVATTKQVAENTAELGQIQDRVRNLEIVTSETSEDLAAVVEQNNLNKVQIEDLLGIATTQAERVTLTENRITAVEDTLSSIKVDSANYATKDDLETLATREELSNYSTTDQVESAIATAVGSIEIPEVPTRVSELENDSKYITMQDVESKGYITDISGKADVEHTHEDLYASIDHSHTEYALSAHDHNDTYADKTHTHEEYLTADALTEYSKFSGSYNDLTDKPEIPSIEGLVKTSEMESAIDALDVDSKADVVHSHSVEDIIDLDLSQYATKDDLETLATPVFTENYIVGTPVGGFVKNESVQNLTVAQILTKLLGLTIYVPPVVPGLPENVPEETPEDVMNIIANQSSAYVTDGSGTLVEAQSEPFYKQMTITESYADNTGNFFYQVIDETTGELVESGYQIDTVEDDELWLTFAIPETVTKFHVELYSFKATTDDKWVKSTYNFVESTEQLIDGYVVYAVDGIDGGVTIRVVIDE